MTNVRKVDVYESSAERYAAGRMQESEELAFETQMLEDPALAEEVAAIQRIREGFRVLAARGEVPQAKSPRRFNALFALAAALALCVIGALVMATFRSPSLLSGKRMPGVTHSIFLTQTRRPEQVAEVPGSGVVEVRILPAVAEEADSYRATLERVTDGAVVASNVETRSDASGYVTLYLDGARLMPGKYRLSLVHGSAQERFFLSLVSQK